MFLKAEDKTHKIAKETSYAEAVTMVLIVMC